MISIATVCNVYDEPAVPISVHTDSILTGLRVKSMGTGRTMESDLCHPTVHGDRVYIPVPGFDIGDRVVFDITGTLRWSDLERWFYDDHEVGFTDYVNGTVACITTPETPSEAPQCDDIPEDVGDVQEPDGPRDEDEAESLHGGVIGCTVAELRTTLLEVMKRQDRAMTVREIAAILNSDTTDARTRIAANLADMEDKGLVKRGGYAPTTGPGRKNATMWVVAR